MNEFQFCYWLMGVFELEEPKKFSNHQLILISEHLKLVSHRKHTFCNWLEGFLEANGLESMNNDKMNTVLNKLRLEFLHVIDNSYPKDTLELLNEIHNGDKKLNLRC